VAFDADTLAYAVSGNSGIVRVSLSNSLDIALGAGRYAVSGFIVGGQDNYIHPGPAGRVPFSTGKAVDTVDPVAAPNNYRLPLWMVAIGTGMVRVGVSSLLSHGIEYPLSDLADARYENGSLFFVRINDERIFEDVQIDDTAIMHGFRPHDARAFVARFREAKARGAL
jgi:hypothetical protein